MPLLSIAQKNTLLDATTISSLSLHTAYDPTGGFEVAGGSPVYARMPVTFLAAALGQKTADLTTAPIVFDVPAATIAYVGMWDGGGGFQGMQPLGGDSLRPFVLDDAGSAVVHCAGHGFIAGDTLVVWAGDATPLPVGMSEGVTYYVLAPSLTTLTLATDALGTPLSLTAAGNGFLQRILPQTYVAQATFPVLSFVLDASVAA
jgi:hypothetical protein